MDKISDEENSTSEEVITTPKNTLRKRKRNAGMFYVLHHTSTIQGGRLA